MTWPGDARCAVVITFDLDAELFWLRLHPSVADRPKTLSLGEYGIRRGVPRLLDLLDEHGMPSTWFVPGWTAQRYPEAVRAIDARGHEIGGRGMGTEVLGMLDPAEATHHVERGARILHELTGTRPRGFRPPPGRVADGLAQILADTGFGWSSGSFGDDLPYFLEDGGSTSRIVEIPGRWEHTDYPYFAYNGGVVSFPPGQSRIAPYRAVLDEWKSAFDAYRDSGLCFVLRLEPQIIGKPGRLLLLDQLLEHIRSSQDTWVTTGHAVAEHWRRHGPGNAPGHPEKIRRSWRGVGE